MKKNLIALAVSAAFVVPAMSQADTTVYGLAQVELANHSPEADGAKSYLDAVDNANGRVGVKASEDLGNGWSGLAKFEFKADTADGDSGSQGCSATSTSTTTGTDGTGAAITATTTTTTSCSVTNVSLTPRETMVGLKGKGVGQFELGRLKSPYKYSGGVKYDPFVATTLEARGKGGMSGGEYGQSGFLSEMIGYRGAFGPVKVQFVYGPQTNDGRYSLSVDYSQNNFEVGLATIDEGDRGAKLSGTGDSLPTTAYSTYSSTKVFGKYNMGMHTIVAQYEMTDPAANGASAANKPTIMFLGYQLAMGKNSFVFEYGNTNADGAKVGTKSLDTTMLVLGAIHKMSKTTRVFGGFRNTTNDAKTGDQVITVGMRKDFK